MIRYFYSLCLLLGCTGLLVQGKPLPSSKASASRPVLAPAPVAAIQPTVQVVTSDISRATRQMSAVFSSTSSRSSSSNASSSVVQDDSRLSAGLVTRMARVTAYWATEGDYYTRHCISATGVRLHDGLCAVDPSIIPYGSIVEIAGLGRYLAVDTGSAVISRTAAREGGHTYEERHALVVDLFFESRREGEQFAAAAAKFVTITWWTPDSTASGAKAARGLFADEDWTKIQSKQL